MVERGLLSIIRQLFHFYSSALFTGSEDKRPTITEDVPIALITQEIQRVWGTMSHTYISHMYWYLSMDLINHNIAPVYPLRSLTFPYFPVPYNH